MSGLLRKICIFIVFGCFAASVAHSATVYTTTLNPTGGTANPDYLTKICKMYRVGGARPDSNGVCSTNNSDYVNPFSLSSSPVNEFPQKYANHVDATDGYETFLGYMPSAVVPRIDNTGNYVGLTNSSGNSVMYAWWGGVTGVTPFTVNYYDGDTLVGTQSCIFGDSTGCDVLSPVGLLTAPTGKYFDGWRCASSTGYNCRANRYLPPDYANLSTPITPYGTSPISNWPNISATRYRDDLRDANGDVVTNMSYEYTGTHVINLYAAWAPYNVTFKCGPGTTSPYVGASTRTQSTYLDANGIIHDIVYGSVIPLDKNFGGASANPLCKSVYYKYDNDNGNDQWCSQYLDSAAGININASTTPGLGEVGGVGGTNYPYTYLGSKNVELYGSCSRYTLYYSCGSFNGETVPGVPPHQRKSLTNNGYISTNSAYGSQNMIIDRRKYPAPAYPYPQTNDGVCETYTLTPTSGANAGVPQEFGNVQIGTATNPGYGCCEKPQYAEFKGYQVRRTSEILNNGELIQPGQYGASNCSVSFNNNTNPDTWQPGCDLWPWNGIVYLDAIWEHTPIQITFNHNGANNAANLVNNVWLKYGEGFYENHTGNGYSGEITQMLPLPQKTGYTFGGYQYCDANDNCTTVVDADGYFITGENNLKFTDVDITVSAIWGQVYTATYSCGTDATGTAPTSDTVTYGTTPTLPSTAGSCAKTGYTLTGWRVDGESDNWVNGTSVWNFASDKNLTAQWEPISVTCSAGQYLEHGETVCSDCVAGNYCPGGTFNYDVTNDQGINVCTGATYSGAGAASCTACPDGYDYNTDAGKTDITQCQIHCNAGTYVGAINGQCENVGVGYWSAESVVNYGSVGVRNACPVGTTTSTETAASESACEIDSKFTIVTTNMTANDTFRFHICSIGNFVVDWGDGSALEVVAQNGTGPRGYTHTYTDAGVHRIRVGGIATQYDANTTDGIKNPAIFFYDQNAYNGTPTKIASIEGSIGAVFPTLGNELNQIPIFYRTFDGATNMTTIPSTLFSGATGARSDMFGNAFKGCSKLTTIPSGLFSGISGAGQRMFADTFNGCSSINAIPSGLFSGVNGSAANMFDGTFEGCSGITAIPSGLFDGVTGYAESMFIDTFYNCSKLTTIPSGLFRNVSGGATSMFQYTFGFCPKLEAIPSDLFDSVTTAADSMFAATFYGDTAIQQIPSGLFRNLSGGASSMFWATFAGCTGLTGPIPANLFSGITTAAQNQFYAAFWGATNLSGYVPATLFSGLNGATATGMMDFVFLNTNLYEECPCGTRQYITGYEDDWSNKVSCEIGVKPNEVWYNDQCMTLCKAGITSLKTNTGISLPILSDRPTTPALMFKYNDSICYAPLEPENVSNTINLRYNNLNYHVVGATQTAPANWNPQP